MGLAINFPILLRRLSFLMLLNSSLAFGQGTQSQVREIEKLESDSAKVLQYLHLGDSKFNDNLDSTEYFYLKAEKIARKNNDKTGILTFINYEIHVLNRLGKYKEALKLGQESLEIASTLKDNNLLAIAYNNVGNQYSYLGNLKSAASNYLLGLKLIEKSNDLTMLHRLSNNLASVFLELKEKDKSFYYAEKGYQYALQTQDSSHIASSLVNLANAEVYRGNLQKSEKYLKELIALSAPFKDITYTLDGYINLGHIYTEQKDYNKAFTQFQNAAQILGDKEIPDYQLYISWGLAQSYMFLRSYQKANQMLLKSIGVAKSIQAVNELRQLYELGAQINEELKQPLKALAYLKNFKNLNDSLVNAETQENIHKLEIEYQTSLKEKAIAEQKLTIAQNEIEIQQKTKWIIIASLTIVVLILALLFIYLIYKNKQKAIAERLVLLEKEKQVQILEAMMAGEEKERSRLAKDLHDGIGGILSATKMHLSIFKNEKNNLADRELENTLGMLDTASKEIRTIAHNLAPELLLRYGLDKAISIFCEKVNNPSLTLHYYKLGDIPRLKNNFELMVYRIVQELVNNIIKHAQASQAIVQLTVRDDLLTLTVEDDGIGIEQKDSNGIGMANLISRVKAINGEMNISSEPGGGTTVYCEFEIGQFKIQTKEDKEELINY